MPWTGIPSFDRNDLEGQISDVFRACLREPLDLKDGPIIDPMPKGFAEKSEAG